MQSEKGYKNLDFMLDKKYYPFILVVEPTQDTLLKFYIYLLTSFMTKWKTQLI